MSEQALVPLQKENERVVRENNDLHTEIMSVKEELQRSDLKWRQIEKQSSSEIADLRFVTQQDKLSIKRFEDEILGFKETLAKHQIAPEGISMTSPLNSNPIEPSDARPALGEDSEAKVWAEELRKADERNAQLSQEMRVLESEINKCQNSERFMQSQIESREAEINRLSTLYEGGQNMSQLQVNHVTETNKQTLTKLQSQMDFINRENHRLEKELADSKTEIQQVDQFIKDRKNMSANIISVDNKNKLLLAEMKQLQQTLRDTEQKSEENEHPNEGARLVDAFELEAEQRRSSNLIGQIDQLNSKITSLEIQIKDNNHVQSAYNSDRKAYGDVTKELKDTNTTLMESEKKLESRLQLAESERDNARSDVSYYKERLEALQSNFEANKNIMSRLNDEKTHEESSQHNLREQIKTLEEQLSNANRDNRDLKYEAEKVKNQMGSYDDQYDELKKETIKVRTSNQSSEQQINRLQMDKIALEKSIEVMQEEKTGLEQALVAAKENERESEKALRRNKIDLDSANESLSIMQSEHKMLSDDLKQKLDDLQTVDRKRSQLEKELFEYRPLKEKLTDIEGQMMEILQKKQKTDAETVTLKGQNRDLESDVQRKTDEVKKIQ